MSRTASCTPSGPASARQRSSAIGIAFLGQSINALSVVGIVVIVAGVVVVNLGGVY
jgi:multidrug transporter EmrE-like cation transporter